MKILLLVVFYFRCARGILRTLRMTAVVACRRLTHWTEFGVSVGRQSGFVSYNSDLLRYGRVRSRQIEPRPAASYRVRPTIYLFLVL